MTSTTLPHRPAASAREIILLPRHWDWLDTQPRSASASLRLLVEEARRDTDGRYAAQAAREQCYRYLRDMAGDRPGFEEACRALFAADPLRFGRLAASWPAPIRDEALSLAAASWQAGGRRHG